MWICLIKLQTATKLLRHWAPLLENTLSVCVCVRALLLLLLLLLQWLWAAVCGLWAVGWGVGGGRSAVSGRARCVGGHWSSVGSRVQCAFSCSI